MKAYAYEGPVMEFDKCIAPCWSGVTYAVSEKKARNNLIFQFKQQNKRLPTAKITLAGKVYEEE